ncbi:MAG: hypothetical protein AUI14_17260 [Actinobacteria bacterium 13_2_20CM_2_71_6]|nr:MAG: hypothetical protein AUI14_17260 [Actinobacteria bacterium 13_2_20CM_2_71_6]
MFIILSAAVLLVAGAVVSRLWAVAGPAAPDATAAHAGHGAPLSQADKQAILSQVGIRGSEFKAECRGSHIAGDDPIVKFGQFGASHIHQFIGNTSTNAGSTQDSLRAGATNCSPSADKTPYWVPALYKNGVLVPPETVVIYYQGITDGARAVAYPQGLKMVAGKALAATPADNPAARWNCVPGGASSQDFMDCPGGTKLQTYLNFPTCWDGKNLDSADHISHMAYAHDGIPCPADHPVPVPRVQYLITYPVNGTGLTLGGTRNGVNVTTAPGWTFHGDFWNVWDQAELQRRVKTCINGGFICGTDGCPIGDPPCVAPTSPTPTPSGSTPPGNGRDGFGTIQAESFDSQNGLTVQTTTDAGGGQNLTTVNNGNWALYKGVTFGASTARQFSARVASGAPGGVSGLVEVRLDGVNAAPIGNFAIANTGGWQTWRTVPANITGVTGTHDVYLTFTSGQPADFVNVNWFTFGP